MIRRIQLDCPQCGVPATPTFECVAPGTVEYQQRCLGATGSLKGSTEAVASGGCPRMFICCKEGRPAGTYRETMLHELVHYLDICNETQNHTGWDNCTFCAYTEARAAALERGSRRGTITDRDIRVGCKSCVETGQCPELQTCTDKLVPEDFEPWPFPWEDPAPVEIAPDSLPITQDSVGALDHGAACDQTPGCRIPSIF